MYNFLPTDINWVKNVKRSDGTAWAYYDTGMEAEFNLNFSKTQKLGARNLNINEVILLFQRVDRMANVVPHTYLTHLVKPLDN